MKTGYQLRGQGIGVVFDKLYENYPSQEEFDAVMKRELESHGFDPETGEPRERWVRVQEVAVDDGKCGPETVCKAKLNEFVSAKLTKEAVDELRKPHAAQGGAAGASTFQLSGAATVTAKE